MTPLGPPATAPSRSVVLAEIVRSGIIEGHHHGSVVALAPDGSVEFALGDVHTPVLGRSCLKPLQALGMVRQGLSLPPELLALACASHSGEEIHVSGVRRILAGAGLDETALRTPPDYPLDDEERDALLRRGGKRTSIHMNCSGKHAAMLATAALGGHDLETYLEPDHPVQQGIIATFTEATGEPVAQIAVDGCGAPLLPASLTALAGAFRKLALASSGPERQIAQAIRSHPEMVSGTRRDELRLLTAIPGAIGKAGAEGCYVVALPDGRAAACKIDDGAPRARPIVMAATLARMGVEELPGVDALEVRRTGLHVLRGGGRPVGEIRAVPELRAHH